MSRPYSSQRPLLPMLPFEVGETYLTQEGNAVTCIEISESSRCARFDDGGEMEYETWDGKKRTATTGWRYNHCGTDHGRVTGTDHDWSDPRNVIPRKAA